LVLRDSWRIFRLGLDADVVHLHLAPAPMLPLLRAIVLCAAARLAQCRVILHAHTNRVPVYVGDLLYRSFLRLALKLVHAFVAVSRETAAALADLGSDPVFIANGIDVKQFRTGPKGTRPLVTFVGTVCERKGILDLRRALEGIRLHRPDIFKELDVVIVGDSAQEGPGVFERIAEQYSRAGLHKVRFLGALDQTRVREILSKSWIFCLPSHEEAFPLSILEGMAAETAVISTSVGDIPSMLDGGEAGVLLKPGDNEGLAEALCALIESEADRRRLAKAGRYRVEVCYDYARMRQEVLKLYARCSSLSI
jgi:glycosyltransferase involved in cell wall biosynthesis